MKRYQKLIILIILSLTVYLVYQTDTKPLINYISLGDGFSQGENSYGGSTYGYEDYIKDYLKDQYEVNHLEVFAKKNNSIEMLKNSILENQNILIKNNNYNLKKSLQEADIITISIGLNDIIYEYNIKNRENLSKYEKKVICNNIYEEFQSLIFEIRKYTKKKIYIIGYPERSKKYNYLIENLNDKYKNNAKKNNLVFIDSNKLLDSEEYFDSNSIYPNTKGYKVIADAIISEIIE